MFVPAMAYDLLHCQGISRLLSSSCYKKTYLAIEWRQSKKCILPYGKGSVRHMRYANAVLGVEPKMTYRTRQAMVHHTLITNNSEEVLTSSSKVSMMMQTVHDHALLHTTTKSEGSSLQGNLSFKEAEQPTQEEKELVRRSKISKAKKGQVPWNKGKRGDGMASNEKPSVQTQVKALITDEERELLRRKRISQANRGRVPWNKGGKHSSETKKRIRAGVVERMKDPKIRERLRLQAESVKLSPEMKMKMRTGIIRAWAAKKKLKVKQELCLREWREMIAETARRGCKGDVVYQWNSYSMLRKQAQDAVPRKKREPTPRRDRLSVEHRLRISAAIKAKWSTADYRINVEKGMKDWVSNQGGAPSRARHKAEPRRTFSRPLKISTSPCIPGVNGDLIHVASSGKTRTATPSSNHNKKPAVVRDAVHSVNSSSLRADIMDLEEGSPKLNTDMPSYKDPDAQKKLEKLKSLRAYRVHAETQKQKEVTARARVLIAQAQEAANALEVAAVKDKIALAPLLETQKLLAEAVYSLESLNRKSFTSDYIADQEDDS